MAENSLLNRLDGIEARFEEVSTLITDPAVIADMKRYVRLNKEYKDLERLTGATRRYRNLLGNIEEAKTLLENETDAEMREMAHLQLSEAASRVAYFGRGDKAASDTELIRRMQKMPLWRFVVAQVAMKPHYLPGIFSRCIRDIANRRDGKWL